jgi:hypothetical protein
MLSSGAMNRTYHSKLVTCLFLTVFLVVSVGSVFGYAWCVGDDGHVEVSYASSRGCCDDDLKSHTADRDVVLGLSQSGGESCGLCLDFSVQYDAVFFKRVKRDLTIPVAALPSNVLFPNTVEGSQRVVDNLVLHPPRVSQTILTLRTVVLLN